MKRKSSAKIKKGDTVKILLGKDSGKTGKVEKIFSKNDQVFVTGINVVKRHIKKGVAGNEGSIIDITKPINISNVSLICPNCHKSTRVGFRIEGQSKLRICRKCRKEINVAA